jgi:hypothetical protein
LFEIGPISEASIGNIQAYYPEQGFVEHVVTPVIGLGWSPKTRWINTSSGTSNRPGVLSEQLQDVEFIEDLGKRNTALMEVSPSPGVAPFEFNLTAIVKTYMGNDHAEPCVGGGGSGALRLASQWQFVVDVNGCKFLVLETNLSGDSLSSKFDATSF